MMTVTLDSLVREHPNDEIVLLTFVYSSQQRTGGLFGNFSREGQHSISEEPIRSANINLRVSFVICSNVPSESNLEHRKPVCESYLSSGVESVLVAHRKTRHPIKLCVKPMRTSKSIFGESLGEPRFNGIQMILPTRPCRIWDLVSFITSVGGDGLFLRASHFPEARRIQMPSTSLTSSHCTPLALGLSHPILCI
jgi:hypothetical protein